MARRGRKRKDGKRYPSGQLKPEGRRKPDKIELTPQMKRHKAIASGGEVGNPLSYAPLSDMHRDALELFCHHKNAAGFAIRCKTSSLDDSGGGISVSDDFEDEKRADRYYSADDALKQAGHKARQAVHDMHIHRRINSLEDLAHGAQALSEHYGFT